MAPIISVIMSVFNNEKYVGKAIQSILEQTYEDFEFIIIDDGSTDRSLEVIRRYAKKDPRIKVLSNTSNVGISKSRNSGLGIASGEFMAVMDSDDICMTDRFMKQYCFLSSNLDYVGVGSEVLVVDPEGWPLTIRGHKYDNEGINKRLLMSDGGAITHSSLFCRLRAVNMAGRYNENLVNTVDFDLFLRLSELGKLANLEDILLKWRQHTDSVNHKYYELWPTLTRQSLLETMKRRSLAIDLEEVNFTKMYKDDYRLHWAKRALKSGYYHTAVKNLMLSIIDNGVRKKHLSFMRSVAKSIICKFRKQKTRS